MAEGVPVAISPQVLEWAFFGVDYVRCIVPIATSAKVKALNDTPYARPRADVGKRS